MLASPAPDSQNPEMESKEGCICADGTLRTGGRELGRGVGPELVRRPWVWDMGGERTREACHLSWGTEVCEILGERS